MTFEILLLLLLVLINGIFAASEIAILTAKKLRLQKMADEGDGGARVALQLSQDSTRFLSTVQVGLTSIGILNGILGEAALADPLAARIEVFGVRPDLARLSATITVVALITFVTIILGELLPKRLALSHSLSVARFMARPMKWVAWLSHPFVRLLSKTTDILISLLGIQAEAPSVVTQEEINSVLAEGSRAGVIEDHEHDIVRNVFRLDDRQIGSLMIPRADIEWIDINASEEEAFNFLRFAEHSRYPVCRGGLEDVLGIVHTRQLLPALINHEPLDLMSHIHPPIYVPETLTGLELLNNFKTTSAELALVIDEYGEVQGIVTLQDVLEAITGEFTPRNAEDAWAVRREDGSWLLDGLIPVPELKDRLGLQTVPEENKGRYQTLSGLVMLLLGRVPRTADAVAWDGWKLEVVDMDGKRIDKVLASPSEKPSDGDESEATRS